MSSKRKRGNWKEGKRKKVKKETRMKDLWTNPDQIPELSADFLEYYKEQGVITSDNEKVFAKTLATRLPMSIRINSCQPEIRKRLVGWFENDKYNTKACEGQQFGGIVFKQPYFLPWYPEKLVWQTPLPNKSLRKLQDLKPFRAGLMIENDNGGLTKQEAVSMIPPLLLDINSKHSVLDVCAAPGSKTTQILEALHRAEDGSFVPIPEGFVVANDADTKRSRMLTHQLQRFGSGSFLVTNRFGQCIPKIHYGHMPSVGSGFEKEGTVGLTFDRILCDVPCSGDGTMRKSPDIWKKWKVVTGNGLHKEQLKITPRAVQLLNPGGLMVYSTCTFNPIENEAVVAQILRENPDLKIVDTSDKLQGLIREAGFTMWKVQDPVSKAWYKTFEDVPDTRAKLHGASMFPPTEAELKKFKLTRCTRILPYKQDTGGFFITLLKKKRKASKQAESNFTLEQLKEEERRASGSRKPPSNAENEPYYSLCNGGREKFVKQIQEFYGLSKEFDVGQLVCRSPKQPRYIYLAPGNIARLLTRPENEKLRIIQAGLKAFAYQKTKDPNVKCCIRISQAGAPYLLPHISKQTVKVSLDTYKQFLDKRVLEHGECSVGFQEKLEKVECGCVLLVLDHPKIDQLDWRFRALAAWVGKNKVQIYVNKQIISYLRHLIEDIFT